jgi:hypothetical protein
MRENIGGRKAPFGSKQDKSQSADAGQAHFVRQVFASQRPIPLRGLRTAERWKNRCTLSADEKPR